MFYKSEFVSMERKGDDEIITFNNVPTWLGALVGYKPHQEQYIGGCTVWHSYPDFHRQGTMMECFLSDIWTRETYRRKHGN